MLTFEELWELLITEDEGVEIEAKKGSEVGKSCWETVSAFSNEPSLGGVIFYSVSNHQKKVIPTIMKLKE